MNKINCEYCHIATAEVETRYLKVCKNCIDEVVMDGYA
jgi:hypothetical protein